MKAAFASKCERPLACLQRTMHFRVEEGWVLRVAGETQGRNTLPTWIAVCQYSPWCHTAQAAALHVCFAYTSSPREATCLNGILQLRKNVVPCAEYTPP